MASMIRDFYIDDEIIHRTHTESAPLRFPVRWAYTRFGQTWIYVAFPRQAEMIPLPAKAWRHLDGSHLGRFRGFRPNLPADEINRRLSEPIVVKEEP